MSRYFWLVLLVGFIAAGCKNERSSQQNEDGSLQWLSMEEADAIRKAGTDEMFLVDVYTDWCGWCKVMDKKTFTDPTLIAYLNENFHVVKFNAEQKETVRFKDQDYIWEPLGRNGINKLGLTLLQGRLSYPSLVFLNQNMDILAISPGFKEAPQLMSELSSL
jgi:thioredoxin-related protein